MSTSATGGYLVPTSSQALPGGLTLNQFIQTVLVGISGLSGKLVRPKWQVAPSDQPELGVNWMAFGVTAIQSDTFAYVESNADGSSDLRRQEELEVGCSFYGPDATYYASLVRDGFQIQQNLEALRAANMGFGWSSGLHHMPDLVNERWIDRIETIVHLRRQIQRVYPILPILSAGGTIHSVTGDEEYLRNWETPEAP